MSIGAAHILLKVPITCFQVYVPYPLILLCNPVKCYPSASYSKMSAPTNDQNTDNAWKFQAPYLETSQGPLFTAVHKGHCHCERVQYQLSRDAPLDAKFCHCRTCQVLHGKPCRSLPPIPLHMPTYFNLPLSTFLKCHRSPVSMGSYIPQRGHQVRAWHHGVEVLQQRQECRRACVTL
jgi:hypothetical protein